MGKPVGLELLYNPDDNEPAVADIIFVHGLNGHRRDTWTKNLNKDELPQPMVPIRPQRKRDRLKSLLHPRQSSPIRAQTELHEVGNGDASKNVFWPLELLPDTLPECRIYTWGYDADILGPSTTTVFQHARNLLSSVADNRISSVDRQRPIVWVTHSLGGVVVKDALNQSRTAPTYLKDVLPATYGVCFLGTPHRGSSLAALGATISRITSLWGVSSSHQIINALKYDAETLNRIQMHFKETLDQCKSQGKRISIRSFCESNKTSGVLVVDHFSSTIDDVDEIVTVVAANHSHLSKFASSADAGYVDVSNALKRWVIELREQSSKYHELFEELRTDYIRNLKNEERGLRVKQVERNHGNTFAWLFSDTVPFQDWLQQREPIFWIHGKPGSAKSTLMKYALLHPKTQELLQKSHQGLWTLIPFFFSDRGTSIQKTVDGLVQELLYQLLCHYEDLMELVISTSLRSILPELSMNSYTSDDQESGRISCDLGCIQKAHKILQDDIESGGARRLCAPKVLKEALMAIVQQDKIPINVLFFVDALDEHHGSHIELVETLKCLSNVENSTTVRIKLCLAGRQESVFPGAFRRSPGFAIHEYTHSDIEQYVVDRVESALGFTIVTEDDRKRVKALSDEVTQRAEGVFVWVKLVVQELVEGIIDGSSISQLRQKLESIPTELGALYTRILEKRKPEHVFELYIMSQILLCSRRSVSLRSLMAITDSALPGIVVETTSTNRMRQRLSSRCGGLLEIYEETDDYDETDDEGEMDDETDDEDEMDDDETDDEDEMDDDETDDEDEMDDDETDDEETGNEEMGNEEMSNNGPIQKQYLSIYDLIADEVSISRDANAKAYSVQFLHQTVKSYLESPGNITSMFRDPGPCPIEDGWSYMLKFCVNAITQMGFRQASLYMTIIRDLFYYAWQLEQCTKTDQAELLDLLLIEREGRFSESFDMRLCTQGQALCIWDCVHTVPHTGLRPDGLNMWQICRYGSSMAKHPDFCVLRCLALPVNSSLRAFDLLFLATRHSLYYYVKRKVLEGAALICPQTQRSLLWAASAYFGNPISARSSSESLELLDLIISKGSCVDLIHRKLTPLGNILDHSYNFNNRSAMVLVVIRKLLCSGADPDTLIRGKPALFLEESLGYPSPTHTYEIFGLLLQHGAKLSSVDDRGFEPLFWTITRGRVDLTEILLRYCADPSNVGNNVNAMEPLAHAEPLISKPFDSEVWIDFQRNAAKMHDLLVRYKDPTSPLPPQPLCQCKQKGANSRSET